MNDNAFFIKKSEKYNDLRVNFSRDEAIHTIFKFLIDLNIRDQTRLLRGNTSYNKVLLTTMMGVLMMSLYSCHMIYN